MKAEDYLLPLITEAGIRRAREALASAQPLERLIALKLSRLDRAREEEKRLRALGGDKAADEILHAEEGLLSDYHLLTQQREKVQRLIDRVPDVRHRTVLEMRYLEGLPFFRIAMNMHYDERQIYRYHKSGLLHVSLQLALEDGEILSIPDAPESPEKSD